MAPQVQHSPVKAESSASTQGNSILKDMLPDQEAEAEKPNCSAAHLAPAPSIHQLLGTIPTPARAPAASAANTQPSAEPSIGHFVGTPCATVPNVSVPPLHAPSVLPAASTLPRLPMQPAPTCPPPFSASETWEPPRQMTPSLTDQAFPSYREKLRATGRGAFQRAFDAGLTPKSMKQDWIPASSTPSNDFMMQQDGGFDVAHCAQVGTYAIASECQQMWSDGSPCNDTWSFPPQLHSTQQMPQMQQLLPQQLQQMPQQMPQQLQQQMPQQLQQQMPQQFQQQMQPHLPQQMQQLPQQLQQQTPQMQQQMVSAVVPQAPMQPPPQTLPQMPPQMLPQQPPLHAVPVESLSQMPAADAQLPESWGPAKNDANCDFDRCMAIVMGQQTGNVGFDRNVMAAQLQMAADCQRYDD